MANEFIKSLNTPEDVQFIRREFLGRGIKVNPNDDQDIVRNLEQFGFSVAVIDRLKSICGNRMV